MKVNINNNNNDNDNDNNNDNNNNDNDNNNDNNNNKSNYARTSNTNYKASHQFNSNSVFKNDQNNNNSCRIMFGIISMKSYLLQLIYFVKIRLNRRVIHKQILSKVSFNHTFKALSRLKLNVRYHKKRYIRRLIELSRLYIHMLYYDYKKRVNRKLTIINRNKAIYNDNNNYKTRLVIKYIEKWGNYITKRISNRLKCSGGHRYFR